MKKAKSRTVNLPRNRKCSECEAKFEWEFKDGKLVEREMHSCQCSYSEFRQKWEACTASGGHDLEEISAGSHSYFSCTKCGASG